MQVNEALMTAGRLGSHSDEDELLRMAYKSMIVVSIGQPINSHLNVFIILRNA